MPTSVNAPDGTQINFPDGMGDDQIKQIMRKKYPPMSVMQPSVSEQTHFLPSAGLSKQVAGSPLPVPNYEQMAEQQETDALQPRKSKLAGGGIPNNIIPEELRPVTDADVLQQAYKQRIPNKTYPAPPSSAELMYAKAQLLSHREGDVMLRNPGATAVAASGYQGWGQMAQGLKQLPQNPLGGVADLGEGAFDAATPLMVLGGLSAPETAAKAVFGATAGGVIASEATQRLTNNPDTARLAALFGTIAGGGIAAGPEIRSRIRARLVDSVAKDFQAKGVDTSSSLGYANHAVDMYEATGDARHVGSENYQGAPGASKIARLQGQNALDLASQLSSTVMGKHSEADVDYETRRAPVVEQPESLDSQIANTQMRLKNAAPLSNKKADLLDVLDKQLRANLASTDTTNLNEVQPGSASGRDVRALMEASDMRISQETPEQAQASRERYLNLTKQEPLGPSKSYDEVTGKEYLIFPSPRTGSFPSDTDHFAKALSDMHPGKGYGDLSSSQQSDVILRAQQYKEEASKLYSDSKEQTGGSLGPTGPFKSPPLGRKGERGSLWMKPKQVPNSGSPLGDLTDRLQQGLGTRPPTADRLSFAEKLADTYGPTTDSIKSGLQKLTAHTAALVDKYRRPAKYTDFDRAIGEFSGDLQRNGLESRRFVAQIMDKVPDKLRREAITNYVQANGNKTLLSNQAAQTFDARLRRGYEVATRLTPDEENIATQVRTYFDNQLHEAQSSGMLNNGVENYVNQIWKKGDEPRGLLSAAYNNDLRPNADLVKKRIFQDYFEGEQAGKTPRSKDIGYLVTAYNKSFSQALASRGFISKLAAGKKINGKWTGALADDGRPIIAAPASVGRTLDGGFEPDTHLVFPRVAPSEELQGYRTIDHPALSNWKWATGDEASGANTFVKGQLQVHPDYYDKLNNAFKTSALRRSPVFNNIMKTSSMVKGTLLSFSAFHQVQEGIHATFHKVNPFFPKQIDLSDVASNKLLDHGLIIGGNTGIQDFAEGLHGTGLTKYVPGVGPLMNKYSSYLFGDYIPRLKMAMANAAVERNLERYKGKYTEDQIYKLSAEQSNAAFGELNYKQLGRDPSTQDALRFMLLAPDFLEARARFVGQALKPGGAEQRMALARGAAGMYVTARIVNKLTDDDYHFDTPFGVVYDGREYNLRSVPGDIENLIKDQGSFVNHRLNPLTVRPFDEFRTGKDEFGRKRDMEGQVMDFVKNVVPIPFQASAQKTLEKGFNEATWKDSALGAVGISSRKYRTLAGRLAHQYVLDSMSPNHESRGISYFANKIQKGSFDGQEASDLISSGKMSAKDLVSAFKMANEPELLRDFNNENIHLPQAVEIYSLASDKERAILGKDFAHKISQIGTLPPAEQQKVSDMLNRIK